MMHTAPAERASTAFILGGAGSEMDGRHRKKSPALHGRKNFYFVSRHSGKRKAERVEPTQPQKPPHSLPSFPNRKVPFREFVGSWFAIGQVERRPLSRTPKSPLPPFQSPLQQEEGVAKWRRSWKKILLLLLLLSPDANLSQLQGPPFGLSLSPPTRMHVIENRLG